MGDATERAGAGEPSGARAVVARNAFHLVLGQVATTSLAIVLSAILGRSLGAVDFGVYYQITTVCTFAYVFVEWGQPLVVIREVARQPGRSAELLGSALATRAALAGLLLAPAALAAHLLGAGARVSLLAMALVAATLSQSAGLAVGMVFRGHDRMGGDALVSVLNKAAMLALVLVALRLGLGLAGVVGAQALAGLAAVALAFRLLRGLGVGPLRVSRTTARRLLAEGGPIVALTAAIALQPYLDAMILSRLVPAQAVGWFGAARNILGTLMAPATILGAAAYPRLARAASNPAQMRVEVRVALRTILWLGALGATGTYLFAGFAVGLVFGARNFGPAATILEVFAPGLLLLFIDILLGTVVYAAGKGNGFAVAKILSVGLSALLDWVFIPICQARYGNGGIGVLVSFAISELVVFTGALVVLHRLHLLQWFAALDLLRALAAAAATIALLRTLPHLPPWAAIPLCIASFAAASLLFGLLGWQDVALVRSLARRPGPANSGGSAG